MKPEAYLIFHLNLAFSSIPEELRSNVIQRCYHPLLDLAEVAGIPIGIELTGWTLEQIQEIDRSWVSRFKGLLHAGRCELIGSGYAQLIGPLAPHLVNEWNQRLGLETYARILDIRPNIAFVNEMAFSSSLVDIYREQGYAGFVMDRDNVRLALGLENQPIANVPSCGIGPDGEALPVLWADSILFQRLQHFIHGDIRQIEYVDYVKKRIQAGETLLPLYANDAEVFDFRPGRYSAESPAHPDGEWQRLADVMGHMAGEGVLNWCSPSGALARISESGNGISSVLVSAAQPIPVKKQGKYNITRWAVTGRDSTWINTICHRLARHLASLPVSEQKPGDWQELCCLWASDLRTHITAERWQRACDALTAFAERLAVPLDYGKDASIGSVPREPAKGRPPGFSLSSDSENILLTIATPSVQLVVNLRRGMSIHSLAFRSHGFVPIVGTLAHGYFSAIALGADFYSGGVVVELPGQTSRITDLERVEPEQIWFDDALQLRVSIPTRMGRIVKSIRVCADSETIELDTSFPGWEKPHGIVHAGTLTLLPEAFEGPLSVACANGGSQDERFPLIQSFDHSAPSARMVSSTTGFGATSGKISLGDERRRLVVRWDPSRCAVMPMLLHKQAEPFSLTRLFFSMLEIDDTTRPGGVLGSITLRLSPGGQGASSDEVRSGTAGTDSMEEAQC